MIGIVFVFVKFEYDHDHVHEHGATDQDQIVISVKDLEKSFAGAKGEVRALRGVSFEVGKGELFTLLGPSGCGKTTTLRCIAGLEQPAGGRDRDR